MFKYCCDFCDKEIIDPLDRITVTASVEIRLTGYPDCSEHHFHVTCFTRLRNKVNAFIAEKGGEIIAEKEN